MINKDKMDDLSEYERIRLQNINRNAAFLSSIGFTNNNHGNNNNQFKINEIEVIEEKSKSKRKRNEISNNKKIEIPTRISRRLQEQQLLKDKVVIKLDIITNDDLKNVRNVNNVDELVVNNNNNDNDDDNDNINYDMIPNHPSQLDDYEFEVYVVCKAWRLEKSHEKNIESYKIFHNDTLCDMIRRKRNNTNWGNRIDDNTNEIRNENEVSKELQECYGIGPSKSKINPKGFALELLELIEKPEQLNKLIESKKLTI